MATRTLAALRRQGSILVNYRVMQLRDIRSALEKVICTIHTIVKVAAVFAIALISIMTMSQSFGIGDRATVWAISLRN